VYRCPPSLGYQHGTADHQQNFVDPDSGAHTQSIDRLWLDAKVKILKKMRGVPQQQLESHLDHVCWHAMYKSENEIFFSFIGEKLRVLHFHFASNRVDRALKSQLQVDRILKQHQSYFAHFLRNSLPKI